MSNTFITVFVHFLLTLVNTK